MLKDDVQNLQAGKVSLIMEKYSFEFKLKLVRAYLQGEGSFRFLGKKYEVDYSTIKIWCANYKEYGEVYNSYEELMYTILQ